MEQLTEKQIKRREYYQNNKERELEVNKKWRENNTQKVIDIREQYKEDGYYREYNRQHREELNKYQKDYEKQFQHEAVYLLADINTQEVLYIGSCSNVYKRINGRHKCNNSNLKLKDRFNEYELAYLKFEYCYLDCVTRTERLYIEKNLIEQYNPILNNSCPLKNDSCISDERKEELLQIMHDIVWKLWNK